MFGSGIKGILNYFHAFSMKKVQTYSFFYNVNSFIQLSTVKSKQETLELSIIGLKNIRKTENGDTLHDYNCTMCLGGL